MKKLVIILLVFFCLITNANSQNIVHFMDSAGYDSLGREQGYWKLITALNLLENGKLEKGIEGWEYGYFIDGLKSGTWTVKNNDGRLIGHRLYENDSLVYEIQYRKNKRVASIIRSKVKPANKNEIGIDSYGEYTEIIVFNKKGRAKKRIYKTPDGKMITEEY